MSTPNITPGWYPDPTGAPRKLYFDGEAWIDAFPPQDATTARKTAGIGFGVIILGIVGLLMSMQPTSLMNGTGSIWLGVGIAAAALAAAFFLGAVTEVKVAAAVLLALGLSCALYMEHQMDEKRTEISHILDTGDSA